MHRLILRRAGIVLTVVGLCDMLVMIYCIINRISFSSSLNILAVIAGIFLWRGSLRAVVIVRWIAAFTAATFASLALMWPVIEPIDLQIVRFNLDPWGLLGTIGLILSIVAIFIWINRELRREPVQLALKENGFKIRAQYIPIAAGFGLVAALTAILLFWLSGSGAQQAIAFAKERMGSDYRFTVNSINSGLSNGKTTITYSIIAWKPTEIQYFTVRWVE